MLTKDQSELNNLLRAVIDTAIDGIITINSQGYIITVNKAACLLFGYESEQLINQKVNVLMTYEDHKNHDTYIHNYLESGIPKIIGTGRELIGRKQDGSTFPFRLAVGQVILKNEIIFTGILHDLTSLKDAEQRIRQLNTELEDKIEERTNQLEVAINRLLKTNERLIQNEKELSDALINEKELNALKTRFIQIASHEFRTPLSTIHSSASLISKYNEKEQTDKRLRHIERIKTAVQNLTGILDDFLSLSKLEEGKITIEVEEIDIHILCLEVLNELSVIIKPQLEIIHEHTGSQIMFSDKKVLKIALFNLFTNAIKYSQQGQIICTSNINDNHITISISDQGLGISIEDQRHLFTRFFRAKSVENIQGTGLGLHIVKNHLALLNGTITFESELGKGSTFTIHIPQQKPL